MIRNPLRIAALALALGIAGSAAAGTPHPDLAVKSAAEMETTTMVDGKKQVTRVAVTQAVPGSEIIYSADVTNKGSRPVIHVVLTNPVPQGTSYVKGSAEAPGVTVAYSTDGGKTYSAPDKLFVKHDGKRQPAAAKDYTHIRWTFKDALPPGKHTRASFRTILD